MKLSLVPASFWLALGLLGGMLFWTAVPGLFTVDENNYLVNVVAMRNGHVSIWNTTGLTPSRELLFFDPGPWARVVDATPVSSVAPPLYALLAMPFAMLGWRGLIALNTLSYLAAVTLVFVYASRYATRPATPWLASSAMALAGFALEYAQGVWPHAVSLALCAGGVIAAAQVIEGGSVAAAGIAGSLLGLASGVRYQNAVMLAVAAGGVALWAPRRIRALAAFAFAAAIPLGISAAINHARLGFWNPISKGAGYVSLSTPGTAGNSWFDPVVMFWALFLDFSKRPALTTPDITGWMTQDALSGAHLIYGLIEKKALLQSAPWAVLAFALCLFVWVPSRVIQASRRRQIRFLSLIASAVVATFAFGGVLRHDGLSFNQRYLLELVPIAAVLFAWSLDDVPWRPRSLWLGGMSGAAAAALILLGTPMAGTTADVLWNLRHIAVMKVPLVMAAFLGVAWLLPQDWSRRPAAIWMATGLCLAWAFTVHVTTDLQASRFMRARNQVRTAAMAAVIPDHSALVAYWGNKDAAGPLLLDRDVVILNAQADEGRTAATLERELLARGRRVFVLANDFPADVLAAATDGFAATRLEHGELEFLELRPR